MINQYDQIYILFGMNMVIYLVGGIPTPLKNMRVNWDDYVQSMEK